MALRILLREDPEVSEMATRRFRAEGIDVRIDHRAKAFVIEGGEKVLIAAHAGNDVRIAFDAVLVAVGRAEKLVALADWRQAPGFSEREQRVLAYAEAMTDSRQRVDDALFARLRQDFDDDGLIELTALIAFQNMSSKFNAALAVPAQGFCHLPEAATGRGANAPSA